MHGQTSTAFHASAGGHAAPHTGSSRQATEPGGGLHPPGAPVRIPPLADAQGTDVTGRWPLRSYLELGALPSAVSCARLHTRQLLWEWQLTRLADDAELMVSELTTNAVQITQADGRDTPVRLWLLADPTRLLILVWDASPLPPVRMNTSGDAENGRGLLLVETLSTRWGFFACQHGGKVIWAALDKADTLAGHD
jgi:anti-sigma regulatory factor (Ser/Thr protein kinase)